MATLGDLLRTMNGLRMFCNRTGCTIRMTRWANCRPFYFQDGVPINADFAERISPSDIYGVEVYDLSEVPVDFQRADLRCGVIAVWTRRGFGGVDGLGTP